ncbi:hypothetical protein F511_45879 [Dorcoceras hygrometricum]|uniref:Uncharacterized protein n=1 Tax=Dorcoceras hygrometricum TaxID=472368 RepID=A0A2Z6ZUW3_9LAMI|nr:hypothetical protein F511_45879 [Dorcoceras hygrometricum]
MRRLGRSLVAASRELSCTLCRSTRPLHATLVGTIVRWMLEAWRHGLVAGRPMCAIDGAHSRMKRRSCSGRARALVPPRFFVAAAAGRPPLRRRSGDVVTAGLNSSRVWFGPVPGSP